MKPRYLGNHDFREEILRGVRRKEPAIEVVRAREVGLAQTPDHDILEYAAREKWIVVSHDVSAMSAAAVDMINNHEPMAGLVLARQGIQNSVAIDDLILIWLASELEDMQNIIRFLPIR